MSTWKSNSRKFFLVMEPVYHRFLALMSVLDVGFKVHLMSLKCNQKVGSHSHDSHATITPVGCPARLVTVVA